MIYTLTLEVSDDTSHGANTQAEVEAISAFCDAMEEAGHKVEKATLNMPNETPIEVGHIPPEIAPFIRLTQEALDAMTPAAKEKFQTISEKDFFLAEGSFYIGADAFRILFTEAGLIDEIESAEAARINLLKKSLAFDEHTFYEARELPYFFPGQDNKALIKTLLPDLPDGNLLVSATRVFMTELGLIHAWTRAEESIPEAAHKYRRARYAYTSQIARSRKLAKAGKFDEL